MPPMSSLAEIGLRRGAVETARDLTALGHAISELSIPVTDIVMVLQGRWFESANTLAEAWPGSTIHLLSAGADELDVTQLQPNVHHVHCPTSAERREYVRDAMGTRPQVIVEHGVPKPERKRTTFRSLFWTLPSGGVYVVEDLDPDSDLRRLLDGVEASSALTAEELKKLPVFDAELARGAAVEVHGNLVIVHKRTDHLFKIREWEDHAVYERRWGARWGEVLHTEAGYEYEPRSTLHLYGNGPLEARTVIQVPERHLRRQLDVTCYPQRLMTRGGFVLAESIRQPHKRNLLQRQLTNTSGEFGSHFRGYNERTVDGELFSFDAAFPGHFGHVTTEQLSHMWGWESARERNPAVRPIVSVTRSGMPAFQRQLFSALGIDPDSIELIRPDEAVHVESIITSTPAFENPHFVDLDMRRVWQNLLHGFPPDVATGRPEKVFISRKPGTPRAASNCLEIERLFEKHGFVVVYPEDLSYAEQAHTFAAAKVIGGFTGSGMFTMMFNPDAKIILVSGDSYIAANEYLFASANGNEIHYFWGASHHQSADGRFDATAFHSDFDFDLKTHGKALKRVLR